VGVKPVFFFFVARDQVQFQLPSYILCQVVALNFHFTKGDENFRA